MDRWPHSFRGRPARPHRGWTCPSRLWGFRAPHPAAPQPRVGPAAFPSCRGAPGRGRHVTQADGHAAPSRAEASVPEGAPDSDGSPRVAALGDAERAKRNDGRWPLAREGGLILAFVGESGTEALPPAAAPGWRRSPPPPRGTRRPHWEAALWGHPQLRLGRCRAWCVQPQATRVAPLRHPWEIVRAETGRALQLLTPVPRPPLAWGGPGARHPTQPACAGWGAVASGNRALQTGAHCSPNAMAGTLQS